MNSLNLWRRELQSWNRANRDPATRPTLNLLKMKPNLGNNLASTLNWFPTADGKPILRSTCFVIYPIHCCACLLNQADNKSCHTHSWPRFLRTDLQNTVQGIGCCLCLRVLIGGSSRSVRPHAPTSHNAVRSTGHFQLKGSGFPEACQYHWWITNYLKIRMYGVHVCGSGVSLVFNVLITNQNLMNEAV